MINLLLKVEKTAQKILRIGIVIYLLIAAISHLSIINKPESSLIHNILLALLAFLIAILLLAHFKSPKLGIAGGALGTIAFLFMAVLSLFGSHHHLGPSFLHHLLPFLEYLILSITCVMLTGTSIKEMIRQKITQPFPKS
ncbi:hypothetical protein [Echinicola sp. 20G]|uniref:hypothetical protein n=1 Tax=Echinicola sp. 20G TaxID=2781961 RepID=UPI00190FF877|nr:hypothetical protein [Echinicola sp. 20G]